MPDPQPKEPTEKQLAIQKSGESIEFAIRECGVAAVRTQPPFMQAVRMAHGIRTIRAALPDQFMHENFMPLQNSPLGFLTDKPDGYPVDVVRDALCEALLRGFMPVNNEFNIISGRFYGTKNGYERQVLEFPGLRDLVYELGVPQLAGDKGALVTCEAKWFIDGVQDELLCTDKTKEGGIDSRIPVKVNGGMGADGILGKATRKMFYRIYKKLTGQAVDDVEEELGTVTTSLVAPADPAKDGRRIRMGGGDKKDAASSDAAAPAPAPVAPAPAEPTEAEKLAAEAAADERKHAGK